MRLIFKPNLADRESGQQRNQRRRVGRSGTIINRSVVANLPPVRGGLGMAEDGNKESTEDVLWWRFSHNKEYQETQARFIRNYLCQSNYRSIILHRSGYMNFS